MVHINVEGYEGDLYIHEALAPNLQRVKVSVLTKGWDYVAVVSGLPGVGKSTFAQQLAKFLDPNFESWQICFTAKEFRDKTSHGKKGQTFILDESFADMNTSLHKDPEFIATINHLQLIRQRNLFLILVLPDFFSLSKNIAIFRASHLFVAYSEDYSHGDVAVFDREAKRELYIKGKQFINYQAHPPNFRITFNKRWFCDEEDYIKRKDEHLKQMAKPQEKAQKVAIFRDKLAALFIKTTKMQQKELARMVLAPESTVSDWVTRGNQRMGWDNATNTTIKTLTNTPNDVEDDVR
jgi:adenylate kinase family enzyme